MNILHPYKLATVCSYKLFWKRKDFCFFKSFRTKLSGNYIIVYFSLESMCANLHINIHILTFQKTLISIHRTKLFEYKTELGLEKHWNDIYCILTKDVYKNHTWTNMIDSTWHSILSYFSFSACVNKKQGKIRGKYFAVIHLSHKLNCLTPITFFTFLKFFG